MGGGDVAQRGREPATRRPPVIGQLEVVQRFQQPVADGAQQHVAASEMVVERHALHSQLGAQPPHAERIRSVALDEGHRCVEDQVAGSIRVSGGCAWPGIRPLGPLA